MRLHLTSSAEDLKSEALKRQLLDCLRGEKKQFIEIAENFYRLQRRAPTDYRDLCQALIATIDRILQVHQDETSLFLHNTLKPLRQIREEALQYWQTMTANDTLVQPALPSLSPNAMKLYISLYQTQGQDLQQWALQLAHLPNYMMGRPIYQREEEVVSVIRTKLLKTSEGYAVVMVDRDKVINDRHSRARKDSLGNALLSLLPNAVLTHNIIEFVHQGKRYYFRDQQLIPVVDLTLTAASA